MNRYRVEPVRQGKIVAYQIVRFSAYEPDDPQPVPGLRYAGPHTAGLVADALNDASIAEIPPNE